MQLFINASARCPAHRSFRKILSRRNIRIDQLAGIPEGKNERSPKTYETKNRGKQNGYDDGEGRERRWREAEDGGGKDGKSRRTAWRKRMEEDEENTEEAKRMFRGKRAERREKIEEKKRRGGSTEEGRLRTSMGAWVIK